MPRNVLLFALCLSTLACDVFYPVRHTHYGRSDAGEAYYCDGFPACNPGDQQLSGNTCPPGLACYQVDFCDTSITCTTGWDAGAAGCEFSPVCADGDLIVNPNTCPPNASCYQATACGHAFTCEHPLGADAGQGLDAGPWTWDAGPGLDAGSPGLDGGQAPDAGQAQCDAFPACFPGDLQVPAGSCSSAQLCYVPTVCGHSITCLHDGSFDAG
jgi:hypothetical protein